MAELIITEGTKIAISLATLSTDVADLVSADVTRGATALGVTLTPTTGATALVAAINMDTADRNSILTAVFANTTLTKKTSGPTMAATAMELKDEALAERFTAYLLREKTSLVKNFVALQSTFSDVDFYTDMPTIDPTRPETSTLTSDAGAIVGDGSTTRATGSVTVLATEPRGQGYMNVVAAFEEKIGALIKQTFTDGTVKWAQLRITGAQEASPLSGNFQMVMGYAVQGEVYTVYPT
ncbi:MAG: hypothetical protein K0U41_09945 [Gammaproteobacteria bacterium]|nr:hypothetical protein [Gammaproteobacteria bacterium]